jgi:hypothetical protein
MNPVPLDPAAVAANAAAIGVAVQALHLPVIAGGLAAVDSAIAQAALPLPFESEPAQFETQLDAHAGDTGASPAASR